MRIMKTLLTVIIISLLSACTSVYDVTSSPVLETEIGEKILSVDAFICKLDKRSSFAKGLPKYRIIKNYGFDKCPLGEHITSLEKGTIIQINSASHRSHWGLFHSDHWYLIGSVQLNGKNYDFYNYLGLTTNGLPPEKTQIELLW
ncbi:MAG: hypothetical protein CL623_00990 [Arcobacter sp.]|nr:hypothetical protein [Arcobacter sp.]|tara:strand:+ start:730 stop:1164 length:435 start_codon:yes stop_codon:yes gene_type:complete